jgi:hypothetical protein
MHVLRTARRLLDEGGGLVKSAYLETYSKGKSKLTRYSMQGALMRAVDLVHPADRSRALQDAHHAISGSLRLDERSELGIAQSPYPYVSRFESHPDTVLEDALRVLDRAIKNQGTVNEAVRKQKGRK